MITKKPTVSRQASRKSRKHNNSFQERDRASASRRMSLLPNSPGARADSLSMQADDSMQKIFFRRSLITIGGALFMMLFFSVVFFFLVVRGAERTVVPVIVDEELVNALIMLQERELYPRLHVKYTGNPSDRGKVIAQDPNPGLYVKAGRRVNIVVSQGAIADQVEDYVGFTLTELRAHLASLFSTYTPLMVIREPVTYVYNDAAEGTILSQSPPPGTPLGEPVDLILVVSRGVQDRSVIMPDFRNDTAETAMKSLAQFPLSFFFVEDDVPPEGSVIRITSQSPAPQSQISPDDAVNLRYRRPASWPDGYRYGQFDYTMPHYPVSVSLKVIIREIDSEERELFSMPHSGGRLTFPYLLPEGAFVILIVNEEEEYRHAVASEQ